MSAANFSTWRDVVAELVPRIRAAGTDAPEQVRNAIIDELQEAARALGQSRERCHELLAMAFMMNHPQGDRFIFEATGARVGTMQLKAVP